MIIFWDNDFSLTFSTLMHWIYYSIKNFHLQNWNTTGTIVDIDLWLMTYLIIIFLYRFLTLGFIGLCQYCSEEKKDFVTGLGEVLLNFRFSASVKKCFSTYFQLYYCHHFGACVHLLYQQALYIICPYYHLKFPTGKRLKYKYQF